MSLNKCKTPPPHGSIPDAPPDGPRALPALYAMASLAIHECEPHEAFQSLLDCAANIFKTTSGFIALLEPDSGKLIIEVQKNLPADAPSLLRPGEGVTGWVFSNARPLLIPDITADSRYIPLRAGVRCVMAAPLENDERLIGVINLDHDTPDAFSEIDFALFTRLAREAAAVITRIWQRRQLREKARQLESLITIGQKLVGKVEQQELLDTIARDARSITQSYACALYLCQHRQKTVTLAAFAASTDNAHEMQDPAALFQIAEWRAKPIPLDSTLVASVINTRRQLDFTNIDGPDFSDLSDIPRTTGSRHIHCALASPMICEGDILGVLTIFTDHPHRFNNDEKRLLAALASMGAVALQNARLYSRVFHSEALLRKNEQLTTLGLLAAEIAHEIRNPLTVIKLLYGSLGLDFNKNDPRRTDMRVIGEKLDQLEDIVSRVLHFAKAPASLHSHWALADIIDDTVVLIRLKFAQNKISLDYEPPQRRILLDVNKGQIQQVLLNLMFNSLQAMPNGGVIRIRTGLSTGATPAARSPVAHIDISDTGTGLPGHVRAHIFDSFLSGRPEGTGLGLAIAKRIMLGHHGDITLLESDASGTTFRLTLRALPDTEPSA